MAVNKIDPAEIVKLATFFDDISRKYLQEAKTKLGDLPEIKPGAFEDGDAFKKAVDERMAKLVQALETFDRGCQSIVTNLKATAQKYDKTNDDSEVTMEDVNKYVTDLDSVLAGFGNHVK